MVMIRCTAVVVRHVSIDREEWDSGFGLPSLELSQPVDHVGKRYTSQSMASGESERNWCPIRWCGNRFCCCCSWIIQVKRAEQHCHREYKWDHGKRQEMARSDLNRFPSCYSIWWKVKHFEGGTTEIESWCYYLWSGSRETFLFFLGV